MQQPCQSHFHRAWQHFRPLLVHFLIPLFLTFYAKSLAVEDANAGLNFEDREDTFMTYAMTVINIMKV